MVPLCILGISIDVSSPTHDPRCAGELLFLFRAIACMLSTEGPSRSLWENPRARERAVDVLLESISLVPPCIQPDCQRLPLFIPTARLPAFATLYPNSHVAFRHGIHRWLGFLLSRLSPLDPYRIIFTNGLGTFRDRSILRAMVSFVRRGVTLIHMELLPLYTWSCCPYSHLHGCTASG